MTAPPHADSVVTEGGRRARSHKLTYALLAVPIAAGAPLGWLLISLLYHRGPSEPLFRWAQGELRDHWLLYTYLEVSTTAVLGGLGWALGRLTDRLTRDSLTDALTGLFNRRYLEARLRQEMERARRHGSSLVLVIIDVDGFKVINDTQGHDAGDAVLRRLARLLREEVRGSDVAARAAGDEFVVLLPHADRAAAATFCERLRAHAATSLSGTTLSIGAGLFIREEHATPRDFFRDVDRALYAAKHRGKNRFEFAG